MLTRIGIGALVLTVVGMVVLAVVEGHRWSKACTDAGGRIEQRWEYASIDMHYDYDAKGNIRTVYPVVTQHYSYHCWVNGQEVSV